MKIVVDSNRVIAALIQDSTTREILLDRNFEFFAPEYIKTEIEKYRKDIMEKADISEEEFEILLSLIFESITIIPQSEYQNFLSELRDITKDSKDVAYFAVCLFIKADGIWTHDLHFKEQKKVKVFTNIDMLRFNRSTASDSD